MTHPSPATSIRSRTIAAIATSLLPLLWLCAGCGRSPDPEAEAAAARLQAEQARAAEQLSALSNQLAAARQAQDETARNLDARLEELDQRTAAAQAAREELARSQAEQTAAKEEQARKSLERIAQLEGEVAALQAGRLLPEITLPPDDAPTPQELEQQIKIVERKRELAAEEVEIRAKALPQLTVGAQGVSFRSADTNFAFRLRGLVQLDSHTFFDDDEYAEGNDSFLLRRARPIIEGTVFRDFDFQLVPDFGMSSTRLFDAWMNYRYRPELQLKAGKFKGPVGLEQLQSDATLPFNERGLVSNFMPTRNVGVQLWGELADGLAGYSAGVFNVAGDGRNPENVDFGDDKEYAARLSLRPFRATDSEWLKDLTIGIGGSYSQTSSNAFGLPGTTGGTRPGYVTPGLQQFFAYNPAVGPVVADGTHWRLSPSLQYRIGPFGILGEYAISGQGVYNSTTFRSADLEHHAWQLSAQWMLTGEPASFTGVSPRRAFDPRSGNWGAWQLVGRFGQLDIDDEAFLGFSNPATSANSTTSWSVGINWWLNDNLRLLTSFTHSSFDGGGAPANPADSSTFQPPATVTRKDENVFMTRLQLGF